MSFLTNVLILIGFGVLALIILYFLMNSDEDSGMGKIFVGLLIILPILGFLIWWFLK